MEIQIFAMAQITDGSFLIASEAKKPPAFYDIIVNKEPDAGGMIEVVRELDNLTLEQASEMATALEEEFPDAGLSWID